MIFFTYLLERYAEFKQSQANVILDQWDSLMLWGDTPLSNYIFDNYLIYHMEALENAFMDIDHILIHGEPLY